MSQIHILDRYSGRIKEVLSNKPDSKIVLEDLHTRNIENHSETYDFVIDYKASENIQNRDRVLIPDEELGGYREFIVDNIDIDTFDGEAEIKTTSSYLEDLQKAKPIEPQTIDQYTVKQAVDFALFNVAGWEAGDIEYGGFRTISWTSFNSPYEVLKIIANRFDLQLDFTIETNGNRVTRRYVHMREKTALFNGKEVRRGKDLADLQVQRDSSEVVTALLCLAPEPEEGEERVTTVVVDDEAQALYGNSRDYIWGIYEPESDDQNMTLNRLTTLGRTELNKRNKPKVDYTIEAVYLDEFLDHEKVLIGDKIRVKDDLEEPHFYVEAIVKEIQKSVFTPHEKQYTLGEIVEFTKEDITKRFEDLRALFTQRMSETRSNFDNIVTIIDTQVERRIFKQDTPPDNPVNDQLWLDTSNPEKPILKRYFNGHWNTEIKAVTEASDIDAITREEAMYEAVLSSLANIEVNHLTLLTEADQVKENQYINDSHRTTIDNNVQIVIETYDTLISEVERFKEDRRLNLEQSNIIHQMMLDYSSAINELRETIVKTTEFAMDRLAYLQSQYSDEQYEGAMQEVASKFGLTFEDGVLRGDPRLAQDLEDTRLELEDKIESARNTLNDMIEEITGDSRNMIVGTSLIDESHFTVVGGYTILDDEELEYVRINKEDAGRDEAFILFHNKMDYLAGETYTLALDFRSDVVDELDYIFLSTDSTKHILHDTMIPQPFNLEATGEWNRYYMQFTPTEDILRAQLKVGTDYTDDIVGEFDIRQIHLYKGTSEMAWQPAPEDNRQYITQLSREITKLENQLSTKMTRDDYDLLEGQIESVSTEVTQTAEAITQKADKSVVDTLNNTVTTHGTQIETHAEGIDKLIEKTEATDESLTVVTNKTNETAEGLEQTITKVTETESALEDAEKQIKQAQADIKTNAEEISTKLSTAQYNTDQEGIISSIDTATSERVQLAEEIKDKVTLTEYENYKIETGTLGDANRVLNITTDKKGKWLRLAINAGNRASARFIIADRTSSQHGTVEFNASVFFNRAENAEFVVNSFAKMTSFPFTKARFLTKDTYDEQYLDLYFNPTRDSTNSISIWMKDNIQSTGWVLQDLPEAETPHGYKATEYEINEEASTNGILRKHEASITNNGKEISLKASQEELDSVNKTLSEKQAELTLDAENIKGEVKGVSDRLSEVSTTVTQNKEEFDVSVRENTNKFTQIDEEMTEKVGKTEVVASINASTEGVKIHGDKVDISAGSSIRIAIDDAKRYADNVSSTAESNAKKHADNKAKAAQEAAEEYAQAQAELEREKAEAYADGIVTDEERARVEQAKANLKEAKEHAEDTAEEAERAAKDYTDIGIENLEVGGRNLLLDSRNYRFAIGSDASSFNQITHENNITKITVTQARETTINFYNTGFHNNWQDKNTIFENIQLGKPYTLSMDVRYSGKYYAEFGFDTRNPSGAFYAMTSKVTDTNGEWVRISATKMEDDRPLQTQSLSIGWFRGADVGDTIEIKNVKLERGHKATDWSPAPEDIQAQIDSTNEEVKDISEALGDFESDVTGFIKDGIIEEAEARAIRIHLQQIDKEKEDIDKKYSEIYGNSQLQGSAKTNLLNAKTSYNSAHTSLKTYITSAISNGKVSPSEASTIDARFSSYASALATLSQRIEQAVNSIANKYASDAESSAKDHADNKAQAAETNAKKHADTKAQAAEKAARDHADAKARAERITAEAYADGKVTAEEQARIKDVNTKLNEAKKHASETAKAAEDAAKEVANLAQRTADGATDKLDSMSKGGRNLLLDSGRKVISSNYNMADYYLTESIPEGTEVTVSFKAKLAIGKSYFRLYNSGGSISMGRNFHSTTDGEHEVFTYTFNWRVGNSNNTFLRVYHMPNTVSESSEIEWIKLEEGKTATGWSPAPEDIVEKKKLISEINLSDESIKIQAEKVDIDGSTINIGDNSVITALNNTISTVDNKAVSAQTQADSARNGNNIVRSINNSGTTVNIAADKINLTGYATFTDLSTSGRTNISGDNIKTGLLQSSNGNTSFNLNTGTISFNGSNGLIVKNSNSSRRLELSNGVISSYADGELTMKFGGYNLEFYNHADDPIGQIQPIYSTGSSRPGLGIIAQSEVIALAYPEQGLYRAVFRSDNVANETVVSGPFNSAIGGSSLRLYANRRIVSSDTNYDNEYTSYDQPTIMLTQGSSGNHITQYFGGVNNRNGSEWRVRWRSSTSTWSNRIRVHNNGVQLYGTVTNRSGNEFYANGTGSNSLNRDSALHAGGLRTSSGFTHLYLGTLSSGEVRITNGYGRNQDSLGSGGITYRDLRAAKLYSDSVWSHQYDNYWVRTPSELRITSRGSTSDYRDIRFRRWTSVSSEKYKTDITEWDYNVLDVIKDDLKIYQYKYKKDENDEEDSIDTTKDLYQRGLIVERETPSEFILGDGINQYEVTSWTLKGVQELAHENDQLKEKLKSMEERLRKIKEKI